MKTKLIRWSVILLIALGGYWATRQIFQLVANSGLKQLVQMMPFGKAGSKKVIIVVHPYRGSPEKMADVRDAIVESRPDAEVLMVRYPARTWSNADCFLIASNICEEINLRYQTNRYESIEFVGYSIGALLARKAYVYGWGETEDMDRDPDAPPRQRGAYEWATNGTVKRFVLLAGMNRGWTARSRPRGMSWFKQFCFTAGKFIGWATGTGTLIRQCERGEPFVSNLRIQWLDLTKEQRPTIIQLLGDTDDIVSTEDNRDVNVSRDFVWVQLSGTGHANAGDFHQPLFGPARKEKFKQALGDASAVGRLMRASPAMPEAEDTNVVEAVVVLHGIRDLGEWTSEFEDALQERFMKSHPEPEKLCVYRPSYGYFPMGSFLLWPARQKNVRWFMDELTEMRAKYPKLKKVHFIGHSNGTYVLASSLRKYKSLKIGRAVFVGSVVRQDFDWSSPSLAGRVDAVRSYVGSSDVVVGWFPRLFEIWPFTILNRDIGSAGFNGFNKPPKVPLATWTKVTNDFLFETRFAVGGHSEVIKPEYTSNIAAIASFVIDRDTKQRPEPTVASHNIFLNASSKASFVVWEDILFFLIVIGMGWAWVWTNTYKYLLRRSRVRRGWRRLVKFASVVIYVSLIWCLLEHI